MSAEPQIIKKLKEKTEPEEIMVELCLLGLLSAWIKEEKQEANQQ